MVFARATRLISQRRRLLVATGVVATTAGVYMATRPYTSSVVHAERSPQGLKLWPTLPGENATVKSGLAKLRGQAAENHFRTALVNKSNKTDFDVVIGMWWFVCVCVCVIC